MAPTNGNDDVLKGLINELDLLSKRGKTKNIESANTFADLSTNVSREEMFKLSKELFGLSRRILDYAKTKKTPAENVDSCGSNVTPESVGEMIRDQLSSTLPGMLRDALKNLNNDCGESSKAPPVRLVERPVENHTLEIENDAGKISSDEWKTVVRKDVKGALKTVPVVKAGTSMSKDGTSTTKLHFHCKNDMDRAAKALESKYKVTAKSEDNKKLDPKVTITGIDPDIKDSKTLLEELRNKNSFIADGEPDDLKVVFFDQKEHFAVLSVSVKMRGIIKDNNDKLCVGLEKFLVKDRYHVIQCYHCQEFGHISSSPFCKKKDDAPTCFYCAGNHASKDCEKKKSRDTAAVKCSNCAKSKIRAERESCTTHKASDVLCPSFVREKMRVMTRTSCSEDAKNDYQKRIRDLKGRFERV